MKTVPTHDSRLTSHDLRRTIHDILREHWSFNFFRPLQEDIINSVLLRNDTLALMPTGGGKSICFQVPALAKEGLCLVISPLIALMKDQVESLRRKGITAFAIYSGMSRADVMNTLKIASNSNCKFLYVSPERLETSLFKEYLPGMNVNLIAVDEAHCISQWGYDFRPPYLRISALRDELPGVPVLALTASATPEVQDDICNKLKFSKPNIFRQSFERANLSYSVFKVDSKVNKLLEVLKNVPGTSIVYCKSRKRTREISGLVELQKFSGDYYHAGLPQDERNRKQEEWLQNKTRVIVCTNAFGMGIDKPDVRTVIHMDVPDSLENYYQEAGRAGRDGEKAYAVLLYDNKDLEELEAQAALRFPTLSAIREVYQSIANYLQIPTGSGVAQYFEFDLNDFIRKFGHDTGSVINILKALEQEGWLSFNEQVFLPSTLQFTTTKNALYEFEKGHPSLEPMIKSLLRAYEGIFDFPIAISEPLLAKLLKKEIMSVKKDLLQLHIMGVIKYSAQKEKPQVFLLRDRVRAEELTIDMDQYRQRKEKFIARIKAITKYVQEANECRSTCIATYFGDVKVPACGICDNCLSKKNNRINKEEFESIRSRIQSALGQSPLLSNQLIEQLGGIRKEKAWKVIEFMQSENKIELDKAGWIRLKW